MVTTRDLYNCDLVFKEYSHYLQTSKPDTLHISKIFSSGPYYYWNTLKKIDFHLYETLWMSSIRLSINRNRFRGWYHKTSEMCREGCWKHIFLKGIPTMDGLLTNVWICPSLKHLKWSFRRFLCCGRLRIFWGGGGYFMK